MATPFPALDGSTPRKQQFDSAPDMGIDPGKRYTATMDTSMGTLVIALDAINADYERHCRAAREIAAAHFDAKAILAGLLSEALP